MISLARRCSYLPGSLSGPDDFDTSILSCDMKTQISIFSVLLFSYISYFIIIIIYNICISYFFIRVCWTACICPILVQRSYFFFSHPTSLFWLATCCFKIELLLKCVHYLYNCKYFPLSPNLGHNVISFDKIYILKIKLIYHFLC